MAHQIACRNGKRRVLHAGDLAVSLAVGLMRDLGVDVDGGAGHVAGAHRLAPCGFHRLIDFAGEVALRGIFCGDRIIMELAAQGKGVGGAAGQHHLIAGHAAGTCGRRTPSRFIPGGSTE